MQHDISEENNNIIMADFANTPLFKRHLVKLLFLKVFIITL